MAILHGSSAVGLRGIPGRSFTIRRVIQQLLSVEFARVEDQLSEVVIVERGVGCCDVVGWVGGVHVDLDAVPIAAYVPVLMFAVLFGLSMDYEVFLLSRVKEEYDRTGDDQLSVARGLERTGRIVTAAAVLIAVVFLAFSTGRVSFMKMFGLGMTLAVLVDAFIVRTTLVPAFMRLAGRANWWAPAPLRRLHERFGFSEVIDLDDEDVPAVPAGPAPAHT